MGKPHQKMTKWSDVQVGNKSFLVIFWERFCPGGTSETSTRFIRDSVSPNNVQAILVIVVSILSIHPKGMYIPVAPKKVFDRTF